jgi:hypothetical protein
MGGSSVRRSNATISQTRGARGGKGGKGHGIGGEGDVPQRG